MSVKIDTKKNSFDTSGSRYIILHEKVKSRIDAVLNSEKIKFRKKTFEQAYYLAYLIVKKQRDLGLSKNDFLKPLSVDGYLKKGPPDSSFGDKFYKNVFLVLASDLPGTPNSKRKSSKKTTFKKAVFQSNGKPSKDDKKAMLYRVNPDLLKGKLTRISLGHIESNEHLNHLYQNELRHFYISVKSLYLDEDALRSNLEKEVNPIAVKRNDSDIWMAVRNFDENMQFQEFELPIRKYSKVRKNNRLLYLKNDISLNYCREVRDNHNNKNKTNHQIIVDGEVVHIQEIEAFEKYKRKQVLDDLEEKVQRIKNKLFSASISSTNGRMHSDFTSFNNTALKYLRFGGENGQFLSSLDLKTSQPCILANLILKKEKFIDSISQSKHPRIKEHLDVFMRFTPSKKLDVDSFFKLTTSHSLDFYRELSKSVNGKESEAKYLRALSKLEMMRILFADSKFTSQIVNVDKVVNGLTSYLKELKKHFNGAFNDDKNHFTLFLQLVESFIFIEKIYSRCAEENIASFTKHDSILFPRDSEKVIDGGTVFCSNAKQVKDLIGEEFNKIGFQGVMKHVPYLYINSNDDRFVGFDHLIEYPSIQLQNELHSLYGRFND